MLTRRRVDRARLKVGCHAQEEIPPSMTVIVEEHNFKSRTKMEKTNVVINLHYANATLIFGKKFYHKR